MLAQRSLTPCPTWLRLVFGASLAISLPAVWSCRDVETAKRAYLASGNRYFEQRKFREAIVEYGNAVKKDPNFGEARYRLAQAYVQAGDPQGAFREYLRAADLLPNNPDAQIQAGSLLLVAAQFEDAKTRAERVLARDPKNVDAQILRGNAMAGLTDLDGAIKGVQEAIQLDPERSGSYTNLGVLQLVSNRYEEAESSFRKAVEIDPESAAPRLALANFYWSARRMTDAEQALKKAVDLEPRHVLANRALATFYLATRRAGEAEKYLKSAAERARDAASQLALADYYISMGRLVDAAKILQVISTEGRVFAAAKSRIAAIEYAEGLRDQAHKTIDEAIARFPNDPEALLVKGRFLLAERKVDEALMHAQAALAIDPKSAPAHYLAANIYVVKDDPERATKSFNEVLKLNPRAVSAQLELSRLHLEHGGTDVSVQLAQQAVKNQPDNPLARMVLARGLMARGQLAEAEAEIRGLVAKYPNAGSVRAQAGTLFMMKKDPTGAKRSFERALELDPVQQEALSGLVALDVAARNLSGARARVEARLRQRPDDSGALLLASGVYTLAGDLGSAERALRRLVELDPSNLRAYGQLALLYHQQHKLDEARKEFEALARQHPQPVAAETMIGMILQVQNKPAEAQKRYERVMAIDPTAAVAANNLAWIYAEGGGNLDLALQLAQAAKNKLPTWPEVNDTLAWIYYKKGLTTLAIPRLEEAVRQDPKNPTYHYHLGLAHAQRGDVDKARRALRQALELDPNFDGSAEARKTLATLQG